MASLVVRMVSKFKGLGNTTGERLLRLPKALRTSLRSQFSGFYEKTRGDYLVYQGPIWHFLLSNYLRAYAVTLFSTHRTETWVKIYDATASANDNPPLL